MSLTEPITPLLVDRATAATMTSLCERSIDALIAAGELRPVRLGGKTITEKSGRTYQRSGRVLIDVDDLRAWIKRKKETPVAAGAHGKDSEDAGTI